MTYGRNNLRLTFRRGLAYPTYLDVARDRELIESVIEFYEIHVGKPYGSINWEELRILIGDDRLFEALRKTLGIFYRPKNIGIVSVHNLRDLRKKVFQIVNEKYGGYVPSKLRENVLKEIEEILEVHNIDEILWSDDIMEKPLVRIRKPSVRDVVEAFNFETIDTICVNSSKITFEITEHGNGISTFAKFVGRFSKLYGLIYDIRYLNGKLKATVEGPHGIFGKPTKYGTRLSLFITKSIPYLKMFEKFRIVAETVFTRRKIGVIIFENKIPQINIHGEVKIREAFDSSIEKSIYYTLKSLKLNVKREPEPVALGDLLYIPDFLIKYGDKKFYVEIAGYWRKEYAEKKAYKIAEVSKYINNIIVISDEKLATYFEKIRNVKTLTYSLRSGKPILPYGKLLRMLKGAS